MANFWFTKIVLILAIFAQTFLPVLASTKNVGKEQCIGKYQAGIDNVTIRYSHMQIKFKGLDETPTKTTIENNGHILKIELSYTTVPTMEVNLTALEVAGIFRLEFMYFQWFKTTPVEEVLPVQLHAVFFDQNTRSYDEAVVLDKKIVVLAFPIQVSYYDETLFKALKVYLKYVLRPNRKTKVEHFDLRFFNLPFTPKYFEYYAYEGSFSELSCQGTVIWIDLKSFSQITRQTFGELKALQSDTGDPLMLQVSQFVKPNGTVYESNENTVLANPGLLIGVLFLIFYSY